jgi:putative transposase
VPERASVLLFDLGTNQSQSSALLRAVGATRAFKNKGLACFKDLLDRRSTGEDVLLPSSANDFVNFVNAVVADDPSMAWHKEVTKFCRESAGERLAEALKAFMDSRTGKRKGRKVGFPRFVKKSSRDSVTVKGAKLDPADSRRLILPTIGSVKLLEKGLLKQLKKLIKRGARITKVTVRFNGVRWQASLQLRVPTNEVRRPRKSKAHPRGGVDLGLTTYAAAGSSSRAPDGTEALDTNGHVVVTHRGVENPRLLRKAEKDLAKAQRSLARKAPGSKNRAKAVARVQELHGKVKRSRRSWMHQETAALVKTHDQLTLEDLSVENMLKNHNLARSISDASWSSFLELLIHKAHRNGTEVRLAGRWQASTQTCSRCGKKRAVPLTLKDRTFVCAPASADGPACGLVMPRDFNSASFLLLAVTGVEVVEPPPLLKANARKRLSPEEKQARHEAAVEKAKLEGRPEPKAPRARGNPWRTSAASP